MEKCTLLQHTVKELKYNKELQNAYILLTTEWRLTK